MEWRLWHLIVVAIVGGLIGLWLSPGRAFSDPASSVPGDRGFVMVVDE